MARGERQGGGLWIVWQGAPPMALERWDTDCDWTMDPWFIRPDVAFEDEWEALGLSRQKRLLAVEGLARVFPPEACREIRDDQPRGLGRIISLFDGIRWPGHVYGLLELGINATVAKPWTDPTLLSRLRNRALHDGAAFEVRVQAALSRAGFGVQRIAESPLGKRPDLLVTSGSAAFEVELKLMNRPDLDVAAEELNRRLFPHDIMVQGFHVVARGSESLAERALDDLESVEAELPEISRAFGEAAARLRANPRAGTHRVGDHGVLVAESCQGLGSYSVDLLPDLPDERKVRRVQGSLGKALRQLSGQRPGIVVIGLFHAAHPLLVERLVIEAAKNDDNYSGCVMVVLCDSFRRSGAPARIDYSTPAFHAFSPRPYRHLRRRELEIAIAIASTHSRPASEMRPARPGDYAVTMSTRRPAITFVNWGTAKVGPGQTATFTVNGKGETRVEVEPSNEGKG